MFCPLCHVYLTEPELVRRNMKYMGTTVIEYDARCPRCTKEIGHVSWGQFSVLPELEGLQPQPEPLEEDLGTKPLIPTPELRPVLRKHKPAGAKAPGPAESEATTQDPEVELCPHCGQPMPK